MRLVQLHSRQSAQLLLEMVLVVVEVEMKLVLELLVVDLVVEIDEVVLNRIGPKCFHLLSAPSLQGTLDHQFLEADCLHPTAQERSRLARSSTANCQKQSAKP